ncbi:hypothetical protein ACOMHN_055235 [Nucella lapillus]
MLLPFRQVAGVKEAFYRNLHNLIKQVDSRDTILILGDFSARVGRACEVWKGFLGRQGIGNYNSNGRLLLEFCPEHGLIMINILFQQQRQVEDNLEASSIQTLAPFGLQFDLTA